MSDTVRGAFWETKALSEMTDQEWEAVCDGCGRCCLIKLQDEDGTVYYTDVACRLLDLGTCRCTRYAERTAIVPECVKLDRQSLDDLWQLPPSCSYRRLAEGRGLPDWHHLLTGDPSTARDAGWTVGPRAVAEPEIADSDELEDHLVDWPVLDQPITRDRQDP